METDKYALDPASIKDPPASFRSKLAFLGPGFILSASIVGSGELIATTILGAKAGSTEYAGYSDGMKNAGISWDEATLDKFIENPDQVVPTNKMKPYTGLTDANVRKQIVEFLSSQDNRE